MKKFNLSLTPKIDIKNIKQPTLFEINNSLDYIKSDDGQHEGIKGEYHARMVVFTNFVLGRKPVLLRGSRSSGKTALMSILKTFVKKPKIIASSSEKADYRDYEDINNSTHLFIPEINKISETFVDVLKDLGEGVASIYKFTDYDRIVRTIKIQPKPFITSIADENKQVSRLGEELISRLTVIFTDSSIEQNTRVIKYILKRKQNPYKKKKVDDERIKELQEFVKSLPNPKDLVFIYLPGDSVAEAIPPLFTDSRRDVSKYIANTEGIALFYFNERIVVEKKNKKNLLITPEDVWYNHRIYNEIMIQSSLKVGKIERKIINVVKNSPELLTPSQVRDKIIEEGKFVVTETVVKKICNNLTEIGYLTRIEEQKPFRFVLNPILKSDYTGNINWKKVVNECKKAVQKQFPEQAEEYIKRFCSEKIIVTDPFTGEEKNILEEKGDDWV